MKKLIAISGLTLVLAGCAGPSQDYIDADAATYRAVVPDASWGIVHNPEYSDEQRERRLNTLKSWRLRLEKAGHADLGGE